jgi:tRNA nucleotidyltransferase (CCA-adding enzyme)
MRDLHTEASSGVKHANDGGETVLARLREIPGGVQLLRVVAGREDAELIGGATRDLLLARTPKELDVVVESGAQPLAQELATALAADAGANSDAGLQLGAHERFETAFVGWRGGRIDIATRRAESYPAPGSLPDVRAGSPEDDLQRRDFTVNAIAVGLAGARRARLRAAPRALEDLDAGRLRILHERSFLDDPTRLLRLARYCARLGFEPEERTARRAAEALRAGALGSVSPARIGAELRLALHEDDPVASLAALQDLGVLSALDPPFEFSEQLARGGLAVLPPDGRGDLLLLASLLVSLDAGVGGEREVAMKAFLDRLEFTAPDRDRAARAALRAPALLALLAAARSPSQLRQSVRGDPLEAIALAAAMDELEPPVRAAPAARRWLQELRHVRLQITGDDLLSAGVARGPEVGRLLDAVLDMRLDGKLDDAPEAQLRAALEQGA